MAVKHKIRSNDNGGTKTMNLTARRAIHSRWKWNEKDGFWVPKNLENHHGNSTLHERLLANGLICAKDPQEVQRDVKWVTQKIEREKKQKVFRKRVEALTLIQEKHRTTRCLEDCGCVFCGRRESKNVYICSTCCGRLLIAGTESIKTAFVLAVWHGFEDKADALLDFIDPQVATAVGKEVESTKNGTYSKLEVLRGTISTNGRAVKRARAIRDFGRKKALPRRAAVRRAAIR